MFFNFKSWPFVTIVTGDVVGLPGWLVEIMPAFLHVGDSHGQLDFWPGSQKS